MSDQEKAPDLPDPMELFEQMRRLADAPSAGKDEELPDPAVLFRQMEEYRQSQLDPSAEPEQDLPDPMELFQQMQLASLGEEGTPTPAKEELPDPSELFERMRQYAQPGDSVEETLPDPRELFQQMQAAAGPVRDDIHLPMPGDEPERVPVSESLDHESKSKGLFQRLKAKFRKEPSVTEESVEFLDENLWGETPLSLQKPAPTLPSPAELFERYNKEQEPEVESVLDEERIPDSAPLELDFGLRDDTAPSDIAFDIDLGLRNEEAPTGEALVSKSLEQELDFGLRDESAPEDVVPELDFDLPEAEVPVDALDLDFGLRDEMAIQETAPASKSLEQDLEFGSEDEALPSPEEMFRRMQEEEASSGEGLPQLPDLDAFKKELEEEERARLDPDVVGDLSGPERFVDTISDSVFAANVLPGFRQTPPPIPEPYEEPEVVEKPEPVAESQPAPKPEPKTDSVPEAKPKPEPQAATSESGPTGTLRVAYHETPEADASRPIKAAAGRKRSYPAGPSPAAAKRQIKEGPPSTDGTKSAKPIRQRRFSRVKLAIFTRQMAVMVHAGIQLHMAISFAAESDHEMNPLLTEMMRKVESGYTYSAAIAEASRTFDPVYVGLVQAGELSGRLPQMLSRLADVLEREVELRKRLVSVVTYPIVLLSVCLLGTLGFVYFVLPTLTPLFDDLGVNLPLPTRILLASRDFILPVIGATLATAFGLYALRDQISDVVKSNPKLERGLSALPFRIPVFGEVYDKIVTARVLYSLSTMLDVGITLNQALARAELTAGNALISYRLSKARLDLADGMAVTDCFRGNDLFNPSALHLIGAGEESAKLAEMFAFVARLFDEEVEYSLETASAVLEPIIMICMGLIVGFITISAALPTIQILQNFS